MRRAKRVKSIDWKPEGQTADQLDEVRDPSNICRF